MDNAKFTKGKWEKKLQYIGDGLHAYSIFSHTKNICDIRMLNPMGVIPTEEQKANALLISKAPEMLEMLIDLRNNYMNATIPEFVFDNVDHLIKQATEI